MSEDLKRPLDGVPHDIVGRTLFAVCAIAALTLAALVAIDRAGAALFAVVVIPPMVVTLQRRSNRERDPVHPSR